MSSWICSVQRCPTPSGQPEQVGRLSSCGLMVDALQLLVGTIQEIPSQLRQSRLNDVLLHVLAIQIHRSIDLIHVHFE